MTHKIGRKGLERLVENGDFTTLFKNGLGVAYGRVLYDEWDGFYMQVGAHNTDVYPRMERIVTGNKIEVSIQDSEHKRSIYERMYKVSL